MMNDEWCQPWSVSFEWQQLIIRSCTLIGGLHCRRSPEGCVLRNHRATQHDVSDWLEGATGGTWRSKKTGIWSSVLYYTILCYIILSYLIKYYIILTYDCITSFTKRSCGLCHSIVWGPRGARTTATAERSCPAAPYAKGVTSWGEAFAGAAGGNLVNLSQVWGCGLLGVFVRFFLARHDFCLCGSPAWPLIGCKEGGGTQDEWHRFFFPPADRRTIFVFTLCRSWF